MNSLFVEALVVGLIVLVFGVALHYISLKTYGSHDLNDVKIYGAHLFLIGVAVHLLCEFTGINKWYCVNGIACN